MSLYQTAQPTPHPTQVRAIAFELAIKCCTLPTDVAAAVGGNTQIEMLENRAKVIEKYLWGGFAPIEKPATPLSTIDELVHEMRRRLIEIDSNDPAILDRLEVAQASLERFSADLEVALS